MIMCQKEMPNEDNKILEYNHGEKSLKVPAIIYADLECLLEKMHSCQRNPKKSYTERKNKHAPSSYSLFTNCSFDKTKNKLDCYRGKYCRGNFCKNLREHAVKIINYEKKELIPLTDEETNSYENQKFVTYVKKILVLIKMIKMHLNYTIKSGIIVITLENLEELLIIFAI